MRLTEFQHHRYHFHVIQETESGGKSLEIYDIDDTLFRTTAQIAVIKNGKVIKRLTNQEFNTYELEPGESFDFSEFTSAEKFRNESEPMHNMLAKLRQDTGSPNSKVIMLTARSDFDDRDTFLDTFRDQDIDMNKVHVHRAGNLPGSSKAADKKVVWVRRYLDTGKYSSVSMYDDSNANLKAFNNLQAEYPNVEFRAYKVTHHGQAIPFHG